MRPQPRCCMCIGWAYQRSMCAPYCARALRAPCAMRAPVPPPSFCFLLLLCCGGGQSVHVLAQRARPGAHPPAQPPTSPATNKPAHEQSPGCSHQPTRTPQDPGHARWQRHARHAHLLHLPGERAAHLPDTHRAAGRPWPVCGRCQVGQEGLDGWAARWGWGGGGWMRLLQNVQDAAPDATGWERAHHPRPIPYHSLPSKHAWQPAPPHLTAVYLRALAAMPPD